MGDEQGRRSVVPRPVQEASHGGPWLAAIWTGLGAAIVCATLAIVVVAACWLPVSGTTGRTNSAIRAGLLTFLSGVHGGITVDGVAASWLPLGMVLIVGLTAWRAGAGLADAVDAIEERDPVRLALAAGLQAASFAAGALVAVPFATLGTSRAPFFGVALGAVAVFAAGGTVSFVRASALREWVGAHTPTWLPAVARAAAATTAVYLLAGALLTAASLLVHHDEVQRLSTSVGGGLGGIPVLLLGVLAAPNAAIAASSYLAGPGFALGTGSHVSLLDTTHGTLPAFPLLGAVPSGAPNPATWTLVVATPLLAGTIVARLAARAPGWRARLGRAAGAAVGAGVVMLILGWQGGGSVGDGRLHTVGASPWRLGAAVALAVGVVAVAELGLAAVWQAMFGLTEDDESDEGSFFAARTPRLVRVPDAAPDTEATADTDAVDLDDADEPDHLAG